MRFTTRITVRPYETTAEGALHHGHIARLALQAGALVLQALGMDDAFLDRHGTFFVVRTLRLDLLDAARENDELTIATWLSSASRLRGTREVTIARARDDAPVASAQLGWVYVSRATLAPARMPPELLGRFAMDPAGVCVPLNPDLSLAEPALPHTADFRIQHRDIDLLGHANTAVYLELCEEAWCQASGGTPGRIKSHQLEFLKSAVYGDLIRIETRPAGPGLWAQRITWSGTGETLVNNVVAAG